MSDLGTRTGTYPMEFGYTESLEVTGVGNWVLFLEGEGVTTLRGDSSWVLRRTVGDIRPTDNP